MMTVQTMQADLLVMVSRIHAVDSGASPDVCPSLEYSQMLKRDASLDSMPSAWSRAIWFLYNIKLETFGP